MSMMFFSDETEVPLPPREVRILEARVQAAPDGRRVALNITLTPFLEYPNLEVMLYRPDGDEERTLSVIGTMERHLTLILHIRQPQTGDYRAQIDLLHEGAVLQTVNVTFALPETIS